MTVAQAKDPFKGVLEVSCNLLSEGSMGYGLYGKNTGQKGKPLKEYAQDKKAILFVNVASEWGLTDSNYT